MKLTHRRNSPEASLFPSNHPLTLGLTPTLCWKNEGLRGLESHHASIGTDIVIEVKVELNLGVTSLSPGSRSM